MMRILILIIMLLPCSLGVYASVIDSLLSVPLFWLTLEQRKIPV